MKCKKNSYLWNVEKRPRTCLNTCDDGNKAFVDCSLTLLITLTKSSWYFTCNGIQKTSVGLFLAIPGACVDNSGRLTLTKSWSYEVICQMPVLLYGAFCSFLIFFSHLRLVHIRESMHQISVAAFHLLHLPGVLQLAWLDLHRALGWCQKQQNFNSYYSHKSKLCKVVAFHSGHSVELFCQRQPRCIFLMCCQAVRSFTLTTLLLLTKSIRSSHSAAVIVGRPWPHKNFWWHFLFKDGNHDRKYHYWLGFQNHPKWHLNLKVEFEVKWSNKVKIFLLFCTFI